MPLHRLVMPLHQLVMPMHRLVMPMHRLVMPNHLTVASGQNSFVLTNKSSQPLEWEILSGVKVVEEKENIAPGFVQKLKTNLEPGEYDMACSLRSNPKGKLTVKAGVGDSQTKGSVN